MAGVLVFGDINVDVLARLDAEPGWGLDNLAPELMQQCGGVGANVAVALAQWGAKARLVGCVGRDAFGDLALRYLESKGVDTAFVQRTDRATTGLFFIPIHPGGQRTIFGSRGANALVTRPAGKCLDGIEAVHLVGYNFLNPSGADAAWCLLEEANQRGVQVSLDVGMAPSRRVPQAIMEVARKVEILFVGLEEAKALTRKRRKEAALKAIKECGAREILVKLGERGCLLPKWRTAVPPFPVDVMDTTGAGDAFAAAYLYAHLQRWDPLCAALLGNVAGAAASSFLGAATAMPTPTQVLEVLEKNSVRGQFREVHWELRRKLHELLRVEVRV